jgi:hypothetical protein
VFYYRIQSPVILIEFDHQPAVIPGFPPGPTRNHIHTVVRTPNGNDYGKDLLRQHYAQHPHPPQSREAPTPGPNFYSPGSAAASRPDPRP